MTLTPRARGALVTVACAMLAVAGILVPVAANATRPYVTIAPASAWNASPVVSVAPTSLPAAPQVRQPSLLGIPLPWLGRPSSSVPVPNVAQAGVVPAIASVAPSALAAVHAAATSGPVPPGKRATAPLEASALFGASMVQSSAPTSSPAP